MNTLSKTIFSSPTFFSESREKMSQILRNIRDTIKNIPIASRKKAFPEVYDNIQQIYDESRGDVRIVAGQVKNLFLN